MAPLGQPSTPQVSACWMLYQGPTVEDAGIIEGQAQHQRATALDADQLLQIGHLLLLKLATCLSVEPGARR